jgi:23S rRNA (cytosine1962-C5)-methyltransferase
VTSRAKAELRPPPEGSEAWPKPWVQMKYFTYHPAVYDRFLGATSGQIAPGALVNVFDKEGQPFGVGFYHPYARVPLRMCWHGPVEASEEHLDQQVQAAITLRQERLNLPAVTDAYRVVHSDGDSIPGLVVDRYADVLSVEMSTLGAFQRLPRWLPLLHAALGTKRHVVHMDETPARLEGIDVQAVARLTSTPPPTTVKIREHGIRYQVDFSQGHKTGFFCDQRDNRVRFGQLARDRRVLDLCSYSGGFSLAAKILGSAGEVTAVDLDENAVVQIKKNADLNNVRIKPTHGDAFMYIRQMKTNGETYGAVVLDPPKFIFSRDDVEEGRRKYSDLNGLAMSLVEPGGLFVTCSCSGQLSVEDFESLVIAAAHRARRKLQIIDRTGAGPDHPVMSTCAESRYLKLLWALVL